MAEEEQMETCQESFEELETHNSIDNPPLSLIRYMIRVMQPKRYPNSSK